MTDKITKALEAVNELHGETLKKLDDDLPLVGYLITVSAILRSEGRQEWSDRISLASSKINKMQSEIEKLRAALKPFADADGNWGAITAHDLRAAADALKED